MVLKAGYTHGYDSLRKNEADWNVLFAANLRQLEDYKNNDYYGNKEYYTSSEFLFEHPTNMEDAQKHYLHAVDRELEYNEEEVIEESNYKTKITQAPETTVIEKEPNQEVTPTSVPQETEKPTTQTTAPNTQNIAQEQAVQKTMIIVLAALVVFLTIVVIILLVNKKKN